MKVKVIIGIFLLSIIYYGFTFASSFISNAYSSLEECKNTRENNNKLYPGYIRSECYKKDNYYYYNICSSDSYLCKKANLSNDSSNIGSNYNRKNKSNLLLTSCKVNTNFNYIKGTIKEKLDKILTKLEVKLSNNNSITRGYVYGFYDYTLKKVGQSGKYKNNKLIQEVLSYLSQKLECGFDTYIKNESNLEVLEQFLGDTFGEKITTNNKDEYLHNFITFMLDRGVNKNILKDYVTYYSLIPNTDRQILISYIDKSINTTREVDKSNSKEEIKSNKEIQTKEYKIIPLPKYNGLLLWVNWNYATDYCKLKYGKGFTGYMVSVPVTKNIFYGSNFFYLTKKGDKLIYIKSPKKLGDKGLINLVTLAVICGKGYSNKELEYLGKNIRNKFMEKIKKLSTNKNRVVSEEWLKVGSYYCSKCKSVYGTYIRTKDNLGDWHRWDYVKVGKNWKYWKVVANGKWRYIYVKGKEAKISNTINSNKTCNYVNKWVNRRWVKTSVKSNYCGSDAREKHEGLVLKSNQTIVACGVYNCGDSLCRKFKIVDNIKVKECK